MQEKGAGHTPGIFAVLQLQTKHFIAMALTIILLLTVEILFICLLDYGENMRSRQRDT